MAVIFDDATAATGGGEVGITGNTIIDRAWAMLNDVGVQKRNPLADMVKHLNDGIQDLIARRPVLQLDDSGDLVAFTELTTSTYNSQELPFTERFREGMAHYLAYRVFELDASDEQNAQMAAVHRQEYLAQT